MFASAGYLAILGFGGGDGSGAPSDRSMVAAGIADEIGVVDGSRIRLSDGSLVTVDVGDESSRMAERTRWLTTPVAAG